MQLFALVGVSAYCLVSGVVGTRLLLLARRTRELPELLIGLALLLGGCIGYTLAVASAQTLPSDPALSRILFFAGMPMISGCAICLNVFTALVYFPESRFAKAAVAVSAILLVGALAMQWASLEPGVPAAGGFWYGVQLYVQAAAYGVGLVVNLRFHAALRRRIPLGLADPLVANRVLMWAFACSMVVTQYVYSIVLMHLTPAGQRPDANPAIISVLGLAAATSILLAFFPPAAYQRFVRGRAEARS